MSVYIVLVIGLYVTLAEAAHDTGKPSDTGSGIPMPWEHQTSRHDPGIDPFSDPTMTGPHDPLIDPLSKTIDVVSPSEVETLPPDAVVPTVNTDPTNQSPRQQWRQWRPFWRRQQFLNGQNPDWRSQDGWRSQDRSRFNVPDHPLDHHNVPGHPLDHHNDPGHPLDHHNDPGHPLDHHNSPGGVSHIDNTNHKGHDVVIKHHDQVNSIGPSSGNIQNFLPLDATQDLTSQLLKGLGLKGNKNDNAHNINKDQTTRKEHFKEKVSGSTNPLGDVLKAIAKNMASNLVDKFVDRVVNNRRPNVFLSGTSSHGMATGRGFSQPFTPIAHAHGQNGEVIPLSHANHAHSPHGHAIPVTNPIIPRFGQRNRWGQNPFLHPATQGRSHGGWLIG